MIASTLKKLLNTQSNFRRRVSVEEQRDQKKTTDPHEEEKLHCVHDLRVSVKPELMEPCKDAQHCSPQVYRTMILQDPDVRWDHVSFVSEKNALWYDPGRIVQVKIAEFCSTSNYVGHVWSRNDTKPGAELSTIETVKHHIDQMMRVKRKRILPWKESGRVFSVENTWTLFQKKLM